ncbi:hypothetical protein L1887_56127 [Cichorium endivia]|nr:hypothetical protein L1887_56127 [Cichorium endivia]
MITFLLLVSHSGIERLNHLLRLHQLALLGRLVGERVGVLPRLDELVPLAPVRALRLEEGHELAQVGHDVALDSARRLHHLVDVLGHHLEVDDAAAALERGGAGVRCELVDAAGDTVVESCAEGDDEIGVLHGEVGVRRAVHAKHVQTERVELVERTQALEGGGYGDVVLLGELGEQLGALGRREDALAGVDDGTLGDADETRRLLELGGEDVLLGRADVGVLLLEGGAAAVAGDLSARQAGDHVGLGLAVGDGLAEDACGDVLGQVDEDGAGAAGGGNLEGLVDAARELCDVLDHDVPLCAGPGDADDVSLLEGVGADGGGGDLTAEDDEGRAVAHGVLHGGDDVGCAGARGDQDDTGLARDTRVALGHVASAVLATREHKVKVLGVVDGVEDGEDGTSGVAKNVLDVVPEHHLVEDGASGHADERLVEGVGIVARRERSDVLRRLLESRRGFGADAGRGLGCGGGGLLLGLIGGDVSCEGEICALRSCKVCRTRQVVPCGGEGSRCARCRGVRSGRGGGSGGNHIGGGRGRGEFGGGLEGVPLLACELRGEARHADRVDAFVSG